MEPSIIPGERGVFDVIVDGKTIFSKQTAHRFPEHREIIEALKALRH